MDSTPNLFSQSQTTFEIKKHSSLVQIGNIATSQERKAMNALIRIAKDVLKRNSECKYFTCDIGIVKRLIGITSNDNILLKEALKNLQRTEIEYNVLNKDKEERWIFSFLAEVKILTRWRWKATTISFEFPSTILNVIKHPAMYVKLDLYIIRWLESKHSIALYEMMKDYQNLGYYNCNIDAFRKLMWIEEWQYKIFTMLKKRVLDKAVSEINDKTDISVNYELMKEWRKNVWIQFKVENAKKITSKSTNLEQHVLEKLKVFWISEKQCSVLIEKHDHQYLLANIRIVEESVTKGGVRNPKGYLLKAIQNDYRDSKLLQNDRIMAIEESNWALSKEKNEEAKEKEKLRREQILSFITTFSEEEYNNLKNEYLQTFENNTFFKKLYESRGFNDKIIQYQRCKFVEIKKAEDVISDSPAMD